MSHSKYNVDIHVGSLWCFLHHLFPKTLNVFSLFWMLIFSQNGFILSCPLLNTSKSGTVMRSIEINWISKGNDSICVELWMAGVIVHLDVLHVNL